MVTLHYHGHSCWEIKTPESRVLIDPFLTGNKLAEVGPEHFDKLDAIILTHGHRDHIGDTILIAKRAGALVVSVFEVINYLAARGCKGHPLHIGGGRQFAFGHVKMTIAHHGSSGPEGEYLGNPAGVVLTIGGKRIYHAGDTGLFLDMQLIAEMNGPLDVALLPVGDNFTMGIKDAVKAAQFLNAKMNIPMHYNTFPAIEADPAEFVKQAQGQGRPAVVVQPGSFLEIG